MKILSLVLLGCWALSGLTAASELPKGMSFIGLNAQGWQAYVVRDKQAHVVTNIFEPRQFSWSATAKRWVYLSASGAIVDVQQGQARTILDDDAQDAMTQFRLEDNGENLVLVRLVDKKSEKTKLSKWDEAKQRFDDVHHQEGKVFDPFLNQGQLFYTQVSCVESCGNIIQELWHKDLATGRAKQLTLTNGTVRHPVLDVKNNRVIYSVNLSGNYDLWQFSLSSGENQPLTHSSDSDLWPSVTEDGQVYFIRRNAAGGQLYVLEGERAKLVALPDMQDIRDLEITS